MLGYEAQRPGSGLLTAPTAEPTLRFHQGRAAGDLPPGRPGAIWSRRDGSVCGRAIVTADAGWLLWDDLGLCRLLAPNTVDVWPRQDLLPDEALRVYRDDVHPIVQQAFGREALHGSAVLAPAGAIAFCGPSGAGKSTLAYALSRRGWRQLADDAIVLDCEGPEHPRVRPLPFRRSLRPRSRDHFQVTADAALSNPTDLDTADDRGPALAAVVLLTQDAALEDPIALRPVAAARAFTELLPHAHCFDPHDAAAAGRLVRHYLAIVNAVPVFALTYRPSFARFDELVACVVVLAESLAARTERTDDPRQVVA